MAKLLGLGSSAKSKLSVVEHHEAASKSALAAFDQTLNSLADAQSELDIDIDAKKQEIEKAQDELKSLYAVHARNQKLGDKIKKFLSV